MKIKLGPIRRSEIEEARKRIQGIAVRTPLIELLDAQGPARIYLKLENLQPIGSFKIRGAFNAMVVADRKALSRGVYTASAGTWLKVLPGAPVTWASPVQLSCRTGLHRRSWKPSGVWVERSFRCPSKSGGR